MKIKTLLVLVCLICFLSISAISAAEDAVSDVTSTNENQQLVLEDNIQENDVSCNNENDELILEENNNNEVSESEETPTLTDTPLTFTQLNETINGNDNTTIYLSNNYTYNNGSDSNFQNGIIINRALTIYGNDVTLDGNHMARIFNVTVENVIFHDINFINGNASSDIYYNGGAIVGEVTAINCNFTNNTAFDGGAMDSGNAINCTFTQNTAVNGGAICKGNAYNSTFTGNTAEDGGAVWRANAYNCTFTNNTANENGGAIFLENAYNCTFTYNSGKMGGAVWMGNAYDSTFTENNASFIGGGICYGNATNCTFTQNNGGLIGGAIAHGNAYNSTFTQNNASERGGALWDVNAYNCTFTDNNAEHGKAMYGGYAVLCTFNGNTIEGTTIIPAEIIVSNYSSSYKSGEKLQFNLTINNTLYNGINATIKIYDGNQLIETAYGLTGEGWIVDLNPGIYTAVLTLTSYPEEKSANATITVNQIASKIYASAVTTTYNVNKYLTIRLKDANGKVIPKAAITVNLGGSKKYTTDKNGQVKINAATLIPKTYTAKITYTGDTNYKRSTASVKVTVKKAAQKIIASAKTYKLNIKTKQYTITLKNNKNQVIKSAKVTLKVNGKTFTTKTNAKGKATFKITNLKTAKKYTATISSPANNYYNKAIKKVKITVKK